MKNKSLLLGSFFSLLGVILGAFGAHALKKAITPQMLEVYQTGVQYQMYHALALILVGLLTQIHPSLKGLNRASYFFTIGIVLFSGSLYLLAITGTKWIGIVTPFGGVSFILGWIAFILAILKLNRLEKINTNQ